MVPRSERPPGRRIYVTVGKDRGEALVYVGATGLG
jgi:hypothetical protein